MDCGYGSAAVRGKSYVLIILPFIRHDDLTPEQLSAIIKEAGIVGMGGATFPTHVKITSGLGKVLLTQDLCLWTVDTGPLPSGENHTPLSYSHLFDM